jgi:hypothetical protein
MPLFKGVFCSFLLSIAGLVSTEPSVAAISTCMNAARRPFDAEAQLKVWQEKTGTAPRVYAYEPVEAEGCLVRTRVNDDYAPTGLQGHAKPVVIFDICKIRAQVAYLRALGNLFWNGSKPDLQAWRAAMVQHDGASRGGSAHGMLRGYRKASERALALGFGDFGPRNAWRTYRRCAVVGGAPSLERASNGAAINAHDAVYRFNDHPVGPRYARSVGNRTTYRVLNSLYAEQPSPDRRAQTIQICQRQKRLLGAVERTAADGHARRHMIEPEVYRTFYEHFGSGGLTGSLGVWFAIGACRSVRLFGFSSPCELGTKYRHYHSDVSFMERVQVNTVKVALWTHMLRCAGIVEWAPPDDGNGDHWCSGPAEAG